MRCDALMWIGLVYGKKKKFLFVFAEMTLSKNDKGEIFHFFMDEFHHIFKEKELRRIYKATNNFFDSILLSWPYTLLIPFVFSIVCGSFSWIFL